MNRSFFSISRRNFLRRGMQGCLALSSGSLLSACGSGGGSSNVGGGGAGSGNDLEPVSNIANIGPLSATADANGLRLPEGFSSRIVATTNELPVTSSTYPWHGLPDGGATFALPNGGWIYASNSEEAAGRGGVGALEFAPDGTLVDAFPLLNGTDKNCAGGPTPWGTWLSCEEVDRGSVWETFPLERGQRPAVRHDALGLFQHEAAAVDPATGIVYLTEDRTDGCFYRFVPDAAGDLSSGVLQAAVVDVVDADNKAQEGFISWIDVPDPSAATESTRAQAQNLGASIFVRGEGCWFHAGVVYFTTTGDTQVWAYTSESGALAQIYNRTGLFPDDTSLNGVDNITVSSGGDVLVAEDSDDMQIQALTPGGQLIPLLQVVGHEVSGFPGEITGPAFDPSGRRLYFSSQRGTNEQFFAQGRLIGVTFEVTGPFVV